VTEEYEALLKELEEARRVYKAANKEWKRIHAYCLAVTAVIDFLETTVDPDLMRIFDRLYGFLFDAARRSISAGKAGARPRPFLETSTLAHAAAIVDVFAKQIGSVEGAIKKCSVLGNVDPIQLKSFRKNVHRRLLDKLSTDMFLNASNRVKTSGLEIALDALRKKSLPTKIG
jgi:hypothetical protein